MKPLEPTDEQLDRVAEALCDHENGTGAWARLDARSSGAIAVYRERARAAWPIVAGMVARECADLAMERAHAFVNSKLMADADDDAPLDDNTEAWCRGKVHAARDIEERLRALATPDPVKP